MSTTPSVSDMTPKQLAVQVASKTVEQKAIKNVTQALQKATRPSDSEKPA